MESYVHSSFLSEQYVMNNIILKSCIVSIKWIYHHLSNQYSIDWHLGFSQTFTIISNSDELSYACTFTQLYSYLLEQIPRSDIFVTQFLLLSTRNVDNVSQHYQAEKRKLWPLWKIYFICGTPNEQIFPFETQINLRQYCCLSGVIFQ